MRQVRAGCVALIAAQVWVLLQSKQCYHPYWSTLELHILTVYLEAVILFCFCFAHAVHHCSVLKTTVVAEGTFAVHGYIYRRVWLLAPVKGPKHHLLHTCTHAHTIQHTHCIVCVITADANLMTVCVDPLTSAAAVSEQLGSVGGG